MTRVEDSREPTDSLAFAEQHTERIIEGDKTLTARYDFERDFQTGQLVALEMPSGERFATARVTAVETESVTEFVKATYEGHQTYGTVESFLDEMREYYPDASLSGTTSLTVIWFSNVTSI